MNCLTNEELESFSNVEEDQKEFEELLNRTAKKIHSYTLDAYGCEYEDESGAVILRMNFDPYDRDLFDFEFVEEDKRFNIKDFNIELD